MVDAIVSMVVQKATEYIAHEAAFLGGVKKEVEWLKRELTWMQCFIKDAEQKKGDHNHCIRNWISEVRDIAYETEDVLDEYMLKCKKKYNFFRKGKDLYGIGKEIESLKERITELSAQCKRYGLEEDISRNKDTRSSNAHMRKLKQQRRSTPSRVARNVVGLKDETADLLAKLVDDEDPHRRIISIRGMGGLGKTTIAGKLYHNERVQKRFKHRAWVYVSQDYTTRDLLLEIAKSLKMENGYLEKMSEDDLEEQIKLYLEGHSYLLVLDDVWDTEVWKILKTAFPDDTVGSRVIITTRELEVAKGSDKRFHFHELRTLKPEESLQLFAEEAYYGNRSPRVGNWEMEMVERCRGLPLAIIVLAGLFLAKGSSQHWEEIRRSLREDDSINNLLALSFDDLSCHLKLCFLYLGLFPEDVMIYAEDVIRLWVAEGLIEQEDELISEDVAVEYLNELANRSLIQIEYEECGRIGLFRLHDLLRDLAIRKGKEINFVNIDNKTSSPVSSSASCRRQAVYYGVERYLSIQKNYNHRLRSLLIFNEKSNNLEGLSRHLSKRFKLLRVLSISSSGYKEEAVVISKDIKNLIRLRYLKFDNYEIREIPTSIGSLKNLQTLEVSGPYYPIKVHNEICKLKELRHLIGFFFEGEVAVDNLTKLLALKRIDLQNWKKNNLEKLINLRDLEIEVLDKEDNINTWEFSFDSIAKLRSLRDLQLSNSFCTSSLPLLKPQSNCQNLRRLLLNGMMELPKEMHHWLPNLEQLDLLIESEMRDDPMPMVEKLQNLQGLTLCFAKYRGPRRIVCTSEGFPQLQVLHLDLYEGEVDEWQVEAGAMPNLRELITYYKHMSIIPERLLPITLEENHIF